MIHCRPKAGYGLGVVKIMMLMLMLKMFRRGDDGKSLAISDDWSSTGGQCMNMSIELFLTVLDGNDIFNSTFCRTKIYLIQKVVSQY